MEHGASAPHHDCLKGKLGVQSALTFSCPCSSVTPRNRNDVIKITIGLVHRAHDRCTDIYYASLSILFADPNQCSAAKACPTEVGKDTPRRNLSAYGTNGARSAFLGLQKSAKGARRRRCPGFCGINQMTGPSRF